ncbi:NifB/NifX family molybdenum-iron cluster-binding protein [Vibrio sp. PP-XX7]
MPDILPKRSTFGIYDETGHQLANRINPALNKNCSGKQALIDMLKADGVDRVIVKNIGERMFSQLTTQGMSILQVESGRAKLSDLLAGHSVKSMTPDDVRKSENYHMKQAQGGCGHHGSQSHRCCDTSQTESADPDHGHGHGHGANRRGHGAKGCHAGKNVATTNRTIHFI